MIFGSIFERFWGRFWGGFGEVFKYIFNIFSYYPEYRVGKDLIRNLNIVLIGFGRFVRGFWSVFGKVLDVFC